MGDAIGQVTADVMSDMVNNVVTGFTGSLLRTDSNKG